MREIVVFLASHYVSDHIMWYHTVLYRIIATHNLATKIHERTKTGFSNRLVANKRLLKAKKSR